MMARNSFQRSPSREDAELQRQADRFFLKALGVFIISLYILIYALN